jgi:hypothetical protein
MANISSSFWLFPFQTCLSWHIFMAHVRASSMVSHLLNELPGVGLDGAHHLPLYQFGDLHLNLNMLRKYPNRADHQFEPHAVDPNELNCMVQEWFFRHTGENCSPRTQHGFVEYVPNLFHKANSFPALAS